MKPTKVQQLFDQAFAEHHEPHCIEFLIGGLCSLLALDGDVPEPVCPFDKDSPEYKAWFSGFDEGSKTWWQEKFTEAHS